MNDTCEGCKREIVPLVEARYTGREPDEHWHYACWSEDRPPPTNMKDLRAQMATASENLMRAFDNLKSELETRGAVADLEAYYRRQGRGKITVEEVLDDE